MSVHLGDELEELSRQATDAVRARWTSETGLPLERLKDEAVRRRRRHHLGIGVVVVGLGVVGAGAAALLGDRVGQQRSADSVPDPYSLCDDPFEQAPMQDLGFGGWLIVPAEGQAPAIAVAPDGIFRATFDLAHHPSSPVPTPVAPAPDLVLRDLSDDTAVGVVEPTDAGSGAASAPPRAPVEVSGQVLSCVTRDGATGVAPGQYYLDASWDAVVTESDGSVVPVRVRGSFDITVR